MTSIGFFTSVDFGEFGGGRTRTLAIYDALKRNFDTEFLNFKTDDEGRSGIDGHVPLGVDVGPRPLNQLLTVFRSVWAGVRSNHDLFYFYRSSGGSAMIAFLLSGLEGRPYVIGVNDFVELREDALGDRLVNRYLRPRVLREADCIVALNNEEMIEEVIEITGNRGRIHVVPNSIDIDEYIYDPEQSERPQVFYVGRKEDIELFLESAKRIHEERDHDVDFVIAGIGPDEFEGYGFIDFLGRIPENELKRQLARSDICVIPYSNEETAGVPVKTLEYMASGCCIVATNLSFNRATLEDRETALLAAPNVDDFTEKLTEAVDRPDLRRELSENARREVERYSRQSVEEKVREIVESVTD